MYIIATYFCMYIYYIHAVAICYITVATYSVILSSHFLIASQAWCFGRFLPLLIGDLIPENNEYWNAFIVFLKIMEYTFAPVLTIDKLDYLQTLIQDFLIEFKRLYPERPLTPKAHYLVHFSTWMKR